MSDRLSTQFKHGDTVEVRERGEIWIKGRVFGVHKTHFYPMQEDNVIVLSEYGHFYEIDKPQDIRKV